MKPTDIKLIGKAINGRWPITDDYREAVVKSLVKIIVNPESTNREKTAAARVLVSAESQNQADEIVSNEPINERGNRFLDLANGLGIDITTANITDDRQSNDPEAVIGDESDGEAERS